MTDVAQQTAPEHGIERQISANSSQQLYNQWLVVLIGPLVSLLKHVDFSSLLRLKTVLIS